MPVMVRWNISPRFESEPTSDPIEVVTRKIERSLPTLHRAGLVAGAGPRDAFMQLPGRGRLYLDALFVCSGVGACEALSSRPRLVHARRVLGDRFDVVIEVLPWSDTRCELRIVPTAGSAFWQWTQGRRHRYWRLAHDAADHLAVTLTTTHRNGAPTCRI